MNIFILAISFVINLIFQICKAALQKADIHFMIKIKSPLVIFKHLWIPNCILYWVLRILKVIIHLIPKGLLLILLLLRSQGERYMTELTYNFDDSCNELRHLLNQARQSNIYVPFVETESSWGALNEQINEEVLFFHHYY